MKVERLPILILYPHGRCNCRCVMCDIWQRTEAEELTREDVERWSLDLRRLGVEEIVLSGGEALMHSDLRSVGEPLKATGAKLTLLTTGLRLADEAALVNAAFDEVIVSLDGPRTVHDVVRRVPGAFDRLAAGVQAIDLPTHARCTVQKANHTTLRATAADAREVGFCSISFLAVDVGSAAFDHKGPVQDGVDLNEVEVEALAEEIDRLVAEESGRGFVRESPGKLRAIVRRFRARLGLEEPQAPPCTAPWVSAVIETDGTLRPCFFHEAVGNAREQGLLGALNSDHAVRFRESLDVRTNSICQRCVCSLNRVVPAPDASA